MTSETFDRPFRRIITIFSLGAFAVAAMAMLGWAGGGLELGAWGGEYVPMAPSTAGLLILTAVALVAREWRPARPFARRFAAAVIAATGAGSLLVLAQAGFDFKPSIQDWLAPAAGSMGEIALGRMSALTATVFLFFSAAMLLETGLAGKNRLITHAAATLAFLGTMIGLIVAMSYAIGAPLLYGGRTVPMALPTAVAFSLLGAGLMLAAGLDSWLLTLVRSKQEHGPAQGPRWISGGLAATFVLLVAIVGFAGGFYLQVRVIEHRRSAQKELDAVADLRTSQIADWYSANLNKAKEFFSIPSFRLMAERIFVGPNRAEAERELLACLEAQYALYHCEIVLYDGRGVPRLSMPPNLNPSPTLHQHDINAALNSNDIFITDLHLHREPDAVSAANRVYLIFWVPIRTNPDPAAPALGALMLRLDAAQFLFPLIQTWPTASPSAETQLVRREGNEIVFLNDQRHLANTSLSLRLPIDQKRRLPAAMAVLGQKGLIEGMDYRGVPVLAVGRSIPDTPWHIVVKIDREEIDAPLRVQAWSVGIVILLLLLTVGFGIGFLQRRSDNLRLHEQLTAERERQALSDRISHLTRLANDIILIADENWKIEEANESALRTYGYSAEEFRSLTVRDLRPPESRAEFDRDVALLAARGSLVYETVHRRKDGSTFDVECSIARVETDGRRYHIAIIHDITDWKRREKLLLEQSIALEQLPDYILVTDAAGAINYVNPAFEAVTGFSRAEATGKTPDILKSGSQDEAFYRTLWATIKSGKVWNGRLTNRRKDGSRFFAQETIAPIVDSAGDITGFVTIGRDISQEMKLEENIRQSQKVETIGQLAGGVAHDFNNMLQVIHGYLEVLLSKESLLPTSAEHKYLTEIKKAADRAARLTQQLLAFSRRQILDLKVLDLNEVTADMLKLIRRVIGEDIRLEFSAGQALPRVKIDAGQIEQALLNLCMNARDAMASGGRLLIETESVEIESEYVRDHPWAQSGRYACLTVSDTGHGMTAEVRDHIFEPFFTTKPTGQGTGLGLSVVYGIIKQHSGMINVYSEPGRGSTIKLYLPVTEEQADEAGMSPGEIEVEGGSETILLAEDERAIRELATLTLHEAGYRVLAAVDGEEAVSVFSANKDAIALVILDAVMPKLNGLEAYRKMKILRPDLRVLFCSGYSTSVLKDRVDFEEGHELIQKPFNLKELLRRTRRLIDEDKQAPSGPG